MNKILRNVNTFFELLTVLLFVAAVAFFSQQYYALPLSALAGVDSEGRQALYLVMFWVAVVIYGVLFVLERFPRLMRYPVPLTADNMERQALLAKVSFSLLSIDTLVCYAWLQNTLFIQDTKSPQASCTASVSVFFGAAALILTLYLIAARRSLKKEKSDDKR